MRHHVFEKHIVNAIACWTEIFQLKCRSKILDNGEIEAS